MKTIFKVRNIANALFVLVFVAGLGSFSTGAQASAAEQLPAGMVTSTQAGVTVAAARPWTAAEMMAAIPYPMGVTGDATPSYDLLNGPDGPAVSVPGALPGQNPGAAPASLSDAVGLNAVAPMSWGGTYPEPFTRLYVTNISGETRWPWSTVGKLFFTLKGKNFVCSASVVGPNAILTAGHCAHAGDGTPGTWSTNIVFVPAYKNGAAPLGQWTIYTSMINGNWADHADPRVDYAGMGVNMLNGFHIGTKTGTLGYAYNFPRTQEWYEVGYPQAAPFTGAWMTVCNSSYAYDVTIGIYGPYLMAAGCDMNDGSDGGPWIMRFGTFNQVNGISAYKFSNHPAEMISPYFDSYLGNFISVMRGW